MAAQIDRGSIASSDPYELTGRAQHLVTLISIEDDAHDEELRVVWEKDLRRTCGLDENSWTHYPRLIVSIDWLKRDRPLKLLRDILPVVPRHPRVFDMLVSNGDSVESGAF